MSDELHGLIDREASLLEILDEDSCQRAYRGGIEKIVSQYFTLSNVSIAGHWQELLELALDLDDVPHSAKAFTLLTTACDLVSQNIIDGDGLEKLAEKVFGSPPVRVVINRFAAIGQQVFLSSPDRFVGKKLDLHRFLPFLGLRSVFDMFTALLGIDDKAHVLQEFLKTERFVDHVVAAINAFPDNVTDVNRAVALFKVVSILSDSIILGEMIAEPAVLTSVLREFKQPPPQLLNAQWAAVSAILNEPHLPILAEHLPRIIGFISGDGDSFFRYQVIALGLIQKLIAIESYRQAAVGQGIIEKISNVLRKFNKHTIIQTAITHFVIAAFQFEDFVAPLLDAVLPIIAQAIHGESIEQRGCAWYFIRDLRDSHGFDVAERHIEQSAWQEFLQIAHIGETPYGGEVPSRAEAMTCWHS
jgi:hypothetical protein